MIGFTAESLLPDFLLGDKNGYALGKAMEKGMEIFLRTLQGGLDTVLDSAQCPEWRLDELAREMNVTWYDYSANREIKRDIIKNCEQVYMRLGTKWAVENVIKSYFGNGYVEEWFEYGGEPNFFRVHSTNPSLREEKFYEFLSILEKVKRLTSRLDGVFIEMGGDFIGSAGFALHESVVDRFDFR